MPDRTDDFDPFSDDDAPDEPDRAHAEGSEPAAAAGSTDSSPLNGGPSGPGGLGGSGGSGDDDDLGEPAELGAAAPITAAEHAGRTPKPPRNGGRRRKIPVKTGLVLALVAVVLLALVPAFASGLKKTPRNRIGISYGGGPFEGSHFQKVVKPGHGLFFNGFFDPLYTYPVDQQSYIISLKKGEGSTNYADSITAPTSDRVQVQYQVATYFKLDTDRLRDFHEQIGLRYSAYTTPGWTFMITSTFRQQIENALQQETRRYAVQDIYGNERVLIRLQNNVQSAVTQKLKAALGEQFFCGPTFKPGGKCEPITFIIKRADPPKSVVAALEAQRNSQISIATAENSAKARAQEKLGIQQLAQAGVSGADYVLLKAIESGAINFWVLPQGNSLTLQTGGSGGTAPSTPGATSGATSGSGSGSGSGTGSGTGG